MFLRFYIFSYKNANEMKNKKYHIVGTAPKRCIIDIPITQIHDRSFSWLYIGVK